MLLCSDHQSRIKAELKSFLWLWTSSLTASDTCSWITAHLWFRYSVGSTSKSVSEEKTSSTQWAQSKHNLKTFSLEPSGYQSSCPPQAATDNSSNVEAAKQEAQSGFRCFLSASLWVIVSTYSRSTLENFSLVQKRSFVANFCSFPKPKDKLISVNWKHYAKVS